jgi:hypothetical protein
MYILATLALPLADSNGCTNPLLPVLSINSRKGWLTIKVVLVVVDMGVS